MRTLFEKINDIFWFMFCWNKLQRTYYKKDEEDITIVTYYLWHRPWDKTAPDAFKDCCIEFENNGWSTHEPK